MSMVARDDALRHEWPTGSSWPLGLFGMALLLATEAALFALLIVSYFYLRIYDNPWPPRGVPEPHLALPLVLLVVLVATSVPMQVAASSAVRGARGVAVVALALALAAQIAYLAAEIVLFRQDLHEFSPRDHAYGSAYYTLLGVHHAHVAAGVLLTAYALMRIAGRLTTYRVNGLRATTLYWHVVNVLAIAVTLTVLSPTLA